jgi:hypothetical protein
MTLLLLRRRSCSLRICVSESAALLSGCACCEDWSPVNWLSGALWDLPAVACSPVRAVGLSSALRGLAASVLVGGLVGVGKLRKSVLELSSIS